MSFQDNSTNGGSITLLYVEAAKQNEVENGSDPKKLVKSFDACPIQFTSLRGSFSSVLIQYSSTMTLGLTKHKTRCGGRTSGCTKSWKNGAACIRRRPGNARSPAKQWEQRSSTTTTADSTTWTTLWTPSAPPSEQQPQLAQPPTLAPQPQQQIWLRLRRQREVLARQRRPAGYRRRSAAPACTGPGAVQPGLKSKAHLVNLRGYSTSALTRKHQLTLSGMQGIQPGRAQVQQQNQ